MKILHASDLHLGISVAGMPFLEDQHKLVDRLLGAAEQVDAVVIAGDIYDHAVASAEAIRLYDKLVTGLCLELGKPVLVCAGNHDSAARLAACGGLLERAGLYVAGSIRDGLRRVSIGDCDFHLVPYFALDEAKYLFPNRQFRSYSEAFTAVLDEMRATFAPGRKNILIAHCFVSGAEVVESDRAVRIGGAAMVGAAVFEGFDYVALGHLHRAQTVAEHVRYSGSPMQLSFGEAGLQKSFTILDTVDMRICELPVEQPRALRVLSGTFAEVLAVAENDSCTEDYIKIVLSDRYAHLELQDIFRKYYPNLLVVEGKAYTEGSGETLSVADVSALSPMDIMERFVLEYTDRAPNERQCTWFVHALHSIREGDA